METHNDIIIFTMFRKLSWLKHTRISSYVRWSRSLHGSLQRLKYTGKQHQIVIFTMLQRYSWSVSALLWPEVGLSTRREVSADPYERVAWWKLGYGKQRLDLRSSINFTRDPWEIQTYRYIHNVLEVFVLPPLPQIQWEHTKNIFKITMLWKPSWVPPAPQIQWKHENI